MEIKKILIRGPNWVGDSVLAIPAMKAIRAHFNDAEITLLVRPWVAGLFTTAPFVDKVWTEARPAGVLDWSRITGEIRERHFDLAVLFPNSFESALMMFLGRVPVRLGYATDNRSILLTKAMIPSTDHRHQVQYYLDLVRSFSTGSAPSIEINATSDERAEARRLLTSAGIGRNERFLVLNPGAAYGSAKRWSEECFAETADLIGHELNLRVAVIGSATEMDAAEKIRSGMKAPAALLTGKTTLETLIGVLSESSLMITNDSGPMHIAAALGVPTIAVFGSTDDRVTGPIGPRTRVVKHTVDCSPCLLRQCPIDHRCMTRITVENVRQAVMELIAHV
jgi:heptosyltransferase-2